MGGADHGRAGLTPWLRPPRAGGWSPGVGTGTDLKVGTFLSHAAFEVWVMVHREVALL